MKQVDILLRRLPKEFDVNIDGSHIYDIVLNDCVHMYDVYVDSIATSQSIYGDELQPIMFRLSESAAECLIDVSLLDELFLYRHDYKISDDIDDYPLYVLRNSGHNYFSLKGNNVAIDQSIYIKTKEAIIELVSDIDVSLSKLINAGENKMSISVSGDISRDVGLLPKGLTANMINQIKTDMLNACVLMLDGEGVSDKSNKISLATMCDKVYLRFYFELEKNVSSLGISETDVNLGLNIDSLIRSMIGFDVSTSFNYEVFCSCLPFSGYLYGYDDGYLSGYDDMSLSEMTESSFSLEESKINLSVTVNISPETISNSITNHMNQEVYMTYMLDPSISKRLNAEIVEDLDLRHSLEYYDTEYLYYWDNFTNAEIGAEIVG